MAEPVKRSRKKKGAARKKRAYASALRAEQAALTRARIVEAAGELFEAEGYGRTTVAAIAERAGVATDTVYSTFGSKARVLTALVDSRLAPAGEANVMDRSEAAAISEEPDQRRQLAMMARDMAAILDRVGPVVEIMRTAAAVEPEMAQVHAEMMEHRRANMARLVGWLTANGPLRVDDDAAIDTVWAIASPDVGRMLREGRGWSQDQHAAWLEQVLSRALLRSRG